MGWFKSYLTKIIKEVLLEQVWRVFLFDENMRSKAQWDLPFKDSPPNFIIVPTGVMVHKYTLVMKDLENKIIYYRKVKG